MIESSVSGLVVIALLFLGYVAFRVAAPRQRAEIRRANLRWLR